MCFLHFRTLTSSAGDHQAWAFHYSSWSIRVAQNQHGVLISRVTASQGMFVFLFFFLAHVSDASRVFILPVQVCVRRFALHALLLPESTGFCSAWVKMQKSFLFRFLCLQCSLSLSLSLSLSHLSLVYPVIFHCVFLTSTLPCTVKHKIWNLGNGR